MHVYGKDLARPTVGGPVASSHCEGIYAGHDKKRPAIIPAEGAGERVLVGPYPIPYLAAFRYANACLADRISEPNVSFLVQTGSVRDHSSKRSPNPLVIEIAVIADTEGGQTMPRTLRSDYCAAVGRDHETVGEAHA
jgi:hypothetical protein